MSNFAALFSEAISVNIESCHFNFLPDGNDKNIWDVYGDQSRRWVEWVTWVMGQCLLTHVGFFAVFPPLFDILEYANVATLHNALPVY